MKYFAKNECIINKIKDITDLYVPYTCSICKKKIWERFQIYIITELWNRLSWEKPPEIIGSTFDWSPLCQIDMGAMANHFLNTSRDGDSTLCRPFQCLATLSMNEFLMLSSLNLSWCSFKALFFCPVTGYLGAGTDPLLATNIPCMASVSLMQKSWVVLGKQGELPK